MKHLGLLAAGILTLGLAGCSSDEPGGSVDRNDGGMYARVRLQLPTGTRATTGEFDGNTNSSDGYEEGQDYENQVKNVTVVLATKDENGNYGYITHASSDRVSAGATPNTFTLQFDANALNNWAGQTVYIFTYCNVNPAIEGNEGAFADIIASVSATPWNKESGFIMANAANVEIPSKTLPSIDDLLANNNTPEKAFPLGDVKVTRVCSRFDYKKKTADNTYTITNKIDKSEVGKIQLVAMAPVELATEYYYIPRVSDAGDNIGWIYGGDELDKYVVSPNYSLKKNPLGSEILAKYTSRTTGNGVNLGASTYEWTTLGEDEVGIPDDDNNWNDAGNEGFDKTGYHIWRYVPENTIPSLSAQLEGITTGVLFKAKITSVTDEKFKAAMDAGKAVYSFNGTIYGDVNMLRSSAYAFGPNSELYKKFVAVFGAAALEPVTAIDETGKEYIPKDENGNVSFKNPVADAGSNNVVEGEPVFKIYRPDTDGNYFVYYIYRNRHNDNLNNNIMGKMEFGTVRNNIYKLMVNTISDFGYSAVPGDDPDFPDPDNPDENPDTYFNVSCIVLPWMVRVNNIDF